MSQTTLTPALDVMHARKAYGSVQALKGVSLSVPPGEFFGLLGPNGAGKTTLIQSIVGLARLNTGSISVFGHNVATDGMNARRVIGYSPQDVNLDRFFTIRKILEYQTGFFGKSMREQKDTAERLLEQFSLTEKAGVQYYKLSGGMQKRVLVAKALVSDPKLLILDEPTAGVDVEQRHELWDYLRALNAKGTTIILTTHYIDEAEALCDRIAIINHGEICETGAPKTLIDRYCQPHVRIITNEALPAKLFDGFTKLKLSFEPNAVVASGARSGPMIEELLPRLINVPNVTLKDIEIKSGSLEDVFLTVTGEKL